MTEPSFQPYRDTLLELAFEAIRFGLVHGKAPVPDPREYPEPLRRPGACFVTLTRSGTLRGCIGSLEPHRPLVEDVAYNAYAAAFLDPRFEPVDAAELEELALHISILHPAQPLQFNGEAQLIAQLNPGVDGLILEADGRRGTFLPTVWESLPDPEAFVRALKRKAGLPPDYWSDSLKVWRYTTESIE